MLDSDRETARNLTYHLGDFEWVRSNLNRLQQMVYDQSAYLITSAGGPRAHAYTLLALLTLDLESVNKAWLDAETVAKAWAIQDYGRELTFGEELAELDWDDLGQLVGDLAIRCELPIEDAQMALDQLAETIAKLMANARAYGDFVMSWMAALSGSALIDPAELRDVWNASRSDMERERIAEEYGFESVASCAATISNYEQALNRMQEPGSSK